jgi:hypothetical protein
MLATGLPRATVLSIIKVPLDLKSSALSDRDRDILLEGFIRGFQRALWVAASCMAFATAACFLLLRQINLDQAHGKGAKVPGGK